VKTPVKTPVKILQLLKEKPELTLPELAALIGKSVRTIERASAKLVKAGELRRIGPDKGGHWEVGGKSEG
jgi:ATP-dependent DNA helicase RecG